MESATAFARTLSERDVRCCLRVIVAALLSRRRFARRGRRCRNVECNLSERKKAALSRRSSSRLFYRNASNRAAKILRVHGDDFFRVKRRVIPHLVTFVTNVVEIQMKLRLEEISTDAEYSRSKF